MRVMAAKRKVKPFMKCRVAGYMELKTPLPTRKHKLSTQATEANRAPRRKVQTHNYITIQQYYTDCVKHCFKPLDMTSD